jgi:hypothetical protein
VRLCMMVVCNELDVGSRVRDEGKITREWISWIMD